MRKLFAVSLILILASVAPAFAQKGTGLSDSLWGIAGPGQLTDPEGVPDSMLSVDITGVESWDLEGDPSNTVLTEVFGAGAVVTGLGYDVTITTVGASWLSEAEFNFGNDGGSVIFANPGMGDGMPGTATYVFPLIDLTDNALPNIPVGADNTLYMEFYETFDDVSDAVDAVYDPTSTIELAGTGFSAGAFPVPTLSTIGLIALLTALAGAGIFLLRR